MTLPDPLVRGWIDSLVERAGAHLRAEIGALASQMQVEMRLCAAELSEADRKGSAATLSDQPAVTARLDERQRDLASVSAVLDATTALDEAASLSAALDVLVTAAAAHAGRVLLVVKRGAVLAGWRAISLTSSVSMPNVISTPISAQSAMPIWNWPMAAAPR